MLRLLLVQIADQLRPWFSWSHNTAIKNLSFEFSQVFSTYKTVSNKYNVFQT